MDNLAEFQSFPKMARLSRECVITEKIDGTNAQVVVMEDGTVRAGSRNRWITKEADNFGFAAWVEANTEELRRLGPGRHFGEWWGAGIQRRYGLTEKRFSLFAVHRYADNPPPRCCHLVPVLFSGLFSTDAVDEVMLDLTIRGSQAAPGWLDPEGVIIYHTAAKVAFKRTFEGDAEGKDRHAWEVANA